MTIDLTTLSTTTHSIDCDPSDDLKREVLFHSATLQSILAALPILSSASIQLTRPTDYFAEMIKSDHHMQKVRQNLLNQQASLTQSVQARKQRENKKFGKKIQQAKLEERMGEKRKHMETVGLIRKRKKGVEELDKVDKVVPPHVKRRIKDKKYGMKKKDKKNTSGSSGDISMANKKHTTRKGKGRKGR